MLLRICGKVARKPLYCGCGGFPTLDGMLTNIMADVNQQIPWMAEQQPTNMVNYVNTSTDWHVLNDGND